MSGGPTIVVKFGASVAANNAFFVVELDDTLNLDAAGEVKSQFYPGDEIYFLMHYDASVLEVVDIRSTAGAVVLQGQVDREKTIELLFEAADTPQELPHNPSGNPSAAWYGRESSLARDGRSITASATPCIGEITYPYVATLAKIIPPPLTLAAEETFPLAVVIYVEAA